MGDVTVFGKPLPGYGTRMPQHPTYPGYGTPTPKGPVKGDPKKR